MREILFRAKRVDNGEWVKGYFWRGVDHIYMIPSHVGIGYDDKIKHMSAYAVEVEPETICQYTGLTDKNGNQIWENDIVDASEEWWSACGPAGHNSPIIKVEWLEGLTGFDPFANCDCDCGVYIDASGCEVIGNIFDNPELLKGE